MLVIGLAALTCSCAHEERLPGRGCLMRSTTDGLIVRQALFEIPVEDEPVESAGTPEPIDAVEMFFNGGEGDQPVFGGPERALDPRRPVLSSRERFAIDRIVEGASLSARAPSLREHHLFPRSLRRSFQRMSIDVEAWTILIDEGQHARIHSGRDIFGRGGLWTHEWRRWLQERAQRSESLDMADAFEHAAEMIETLRLAPYGLLEPYASQVKTDDPDDEGDGGPPRRCLPCRPVPVGGLAYEFHSAAQGNRPHRGMANHTHHLRMHQSPPFAGCRCFWHRNFMEPTEGFSPLPGAIPVWPAEGGGMAP